MFAALSAPTSTNHVANHLQPRYTSQMPAIFTQQIAKEAEMNEMHHKLDAQRIANLKTAKHRVVAYGWHEASPL
jgi:hypothetical protein